MKDTTGLWVYRFAFVALVGIGVGLLNTLLQVRLAWYPSFEEKMLLQMKQYEDVLQPPAKPHPVAKLRRHARHARKRS